MPAWQFISLPICDDKQTTIRT